MDEIKLATKAPPSEETINAAEAVENISNALGLLGSIISELVNVDTVKNVVSGALHYFAEKIEKYFDEKTKCYEKWGSLGWSFSPSMNFEMFETNINSQNEANEMMKHFVKRREINKIVVSLIHTGVDKEEILEAKKCYNKKNYKACVLLLFGIIENKLISYNFKTVKWNKECIASGQNALKQFKEKCDNVGSRRYENMLVAIITAALKMFEYGDDFKADMTIINRNYLAHGMSKRNISKLECFQVWCLSYSICVLLDVIEERSKNNT